MCQELLYFQKLNDISKYLFSNHFQTYFPLKILICVFKRGRFFHFVKQNLFYLSQKGQCASHIYSAHLYLLNY